mmetsp:Transcript_16698/g.26776  ORF Transcript_16698/g.26776 Transcript_16698/m.26776 type:complete len:651 (-) Transcript_16698:71-2023(-)
MSLILVIMIDHIWIEYDPDLDLLDKVSKDKASKKANDSILLAGACCAFVVIMTWLHSCTETWVINYAKMGLTGKQLRDWIVAQLIWADDGRLNMMRLADYLNAGTSEVEAASAIYENLFPAVERVAHFFFNVALIVYLNWYATPLILVLMPITIVVQLARRSTTTHLLDMRQRAERQYVSALADIIENTHTFRSMPSSNILSIFGVDTESFSVAHLAAVQFTVVTKEKIDFIQGIMLAGIFFASAIYVNNGTLTKGGAVGIIQAFISGSKDIIELSAILLKMKFNSEGLRMVCRILNYPTDAHSLALDMMAKEQMLKQCMEIEEEGGDVKAKISQSRKNTFVCMEDLLRCNAKMQWVSEIILAKTAYKCALTTSMQTARGMLSEGAFERTISAEVRLQLSNTPLIRINAKFKLGGVLLLQDGNASRRAENLHEDHPEPFTDVRDTMMKLIAGIHISPQNDPGILYKPSSLRYAYVSETPALLEGSILKNLLLGVEQRGAADEPGPREAWELARRCGLSEQFASAPDSFSVGKGGRNLPLSARQIVSIVRVLLTDADVIMLHKPTALLTREETNLVLAVLKQFADFGGLWGILDPAAATMHGDTPTEYLTGNGTRTIIMTMSHRERDTVPSITSRIIKCQASWEKLPHGNG